MDAKVNYTLVGIFVIGLTAAIILAIIWLSAGFSNKTYVTYLVKMNESVTGLNVDSLVKYSGVDVGKVIKMCLNPINPQLVDVLVKIEKGTPVTRSTVATLSTLGITGVAYLDLRSTNGEDKRPLLATPGERYPVIPSTPSLFFRLDQAITKFTNDFRKISISISSVLDAENRHSIKSTLNNLDQITTELAGQTKQLKAIINNTAIASKKLPQLFDNSQKAVQTFNNQTLPSVNNILNGVQNITTNLEQTSQNVKDNPAIILRGQTNNAPGPGE